jgi:hypothetical protein
MVSVLSGAPYELAVEGRQWRLSTADLTASFEMPAGSFESIAVSG